MRLGQARSQTQGLQAQVTQTQAINKKLVERNFVLREKFLKLVELIQKDFVEKDERHHDQEIIIANLTTQNKSLRKVLGISKIQAEEFEKRRVELGR